MICAHLHFSAASDKNYKQILSKVCPTHLQSFVEKRLTIFRLPFSSCFHGDLSVQNVILEFLNIFYCAVFFFLRKSIVVCQDQKYYHVSCWSWLICWFYCFFGFLSASAALYQDRVLSFQRTPLLPGVPKCLATSASVRQIHQQVLVLLLRRRRPLMLHPLLLL